MSFFDLVASMDTTVADEFQQVDAAGNPLLLTIHFADGSPDVKVGIVIKNPAMEEDYIPGTGATQGTGVLIVFLPGFASMTKQPKHGDTATYNGVDYDIFQDEADRVNSATLRMRRRGQRWDQ